jgi:hypothetical protein
MPTYEFADFFRSNNVFLMGEYSEAEHLSFLQQFVNSTFDYDAVVKSLGVELLQPSKNRQANVYLIGHTTEEVMSIQAEGNKKPPPVGGLQLTLWSDGRAQVDILY